MKVSVDIIPLSIPAGANSGTATLQVQPGKIIGVCVYTNGKESTSPGFVRAEIANSAGTPVSKMHALANYKRSSGGSYAESFMPLDIDGGQRLTVNVLATAPFADAVNIEFVFLYQKECSLEANY